MGVQVASLYGLLSLQDDMSGGLEKAKGNLGSFGSQLGNIGGQLQSFGAKMTVATAPLAAGLGLAVSSAMEFDEAMTNIGAVLNLDPIDELHGMRQELIAMGAASREGPLAVAQAMYDVVGGVSDASTHMDILSAAIATSEAGNSELAGTTKALISVMNSYKFAADQAAFASDVLTRTVGMGVGTMDELSAAMPQITGLANSLGIGFDDLGAQIAYLSTQGNTFSQAGTQIAAMMTAMLNPNETMKAALQELGYSTGQAAIEQLGLIEAFKALSGTQTATEQGMAKMAGSVEALRGITSFAGPDVAAFFEKFTSGVDGATEAAQQIQMSSAAAQFDLLKSQVEALGIRIGEALLPALMDIVTQITPIVQSVTDWIVQNPELTGQILGLTIALVAAGPIIGLIGTAMTVMSGIVGVATGAFGLLRGAMMFLLGPAGLIIAAIAGIIMAAEALYPGGFAQMLVDAATAARQLGIILLTVLRPAIDWVKARLAELMNTLQPIVNKMIELGGYLSQFSVNGVLPGTIDKSAATANFIANHAGNFGTRDAGGSGFANQPVMIGTGAQPELFVPHTSGNFYPANQQGGGMTITGPITVYAADVNDFERQLQRQRQRMG